MPVIAETVKDAVNLTGSGIDKGSGVNVQVDFNDGAGALGHGRVEVRDILVEEDSVIQTTTVQTEITITKTVASEVPLIGQDLQSLGQCENVNDNTQVETDDPKPHVERAGTKLEVEDNDPKGPLESVGSKPQVESGGLKPKMENDDPKGQLESVGSKAQLESDDLRPQLDIEDTKAQLENEGGLKAQHEDDVRDSSAPNNQVEVSPNLGIQVKSDYISTDSLSDNENIELKDNLIADNVKLDLDVVKPEMLEPSSCTVVPISGESHPMDVEEPFENKAPVDERDDKNVANVDMSNKNDSAELAYSEKLNLDKVLAMTLWRRMCLRVNKLIQNVVLMKWVKSEKNGAPIVKEKSPDAVVGDGLPADKKDILGLKKRRLGAKRGEAMKKSPLKKQAWRIPKAPLKRSPWTASCPGFRRSPWALFV